MLANFLKNFLEVKRVLKKEGYYIIGQGNMFTLNDLISFRKFLKCLVWYLTNEKYMHSYSLSYRDIIFETKLKKYFLKYENSRFLKSNFMNKKSNKWNYKIHKRIFSFNSLKNTIESNEFSVVKFYGGPFLYSSENKTSISKKSYK
jgi:tRNA A22 N-methylase